MEVKLTANNHTITKADKNSVTIIIFDEELDIKQKFVQIIVIDFYYANILQVNLKHKYQIPYTKK